MHGCWICLLHQSGRHRESLSPGATWWLLCICIYAALNAAIYTAREEKTVTVREGGCLGEEEESGNREWESEREKRLWNNSSLSERKKRVKHGPTGLGCQYKPSSGESCHRPLAERWKETDWRGNIVPSRLLPHYIHHTPPLDYLNPDNTRTADTPTPNLPALYQALLFLRLSVSIPSSIYLSFSPFSLTTLKVRVGCAQ